MGSISSPIYPKQPGALLSLLTLSEGKQGDTFFFRGNWLYLIKGQGYFSSCKTSYPKDELSIEVPGWHESLRLGENLHFATVAGGRSNLYKDSGWKQTSALPETNTLPLKINGWKMKFPAYFSGTKQLVSGSVFHPVKSWLAKKVDFFKDGHALTYTPENQPGIHKWRFRKWIFHVSFRGKKLESKTASYNSIQPTIVFTPVDPKWIFNTHPLRLAATFTKSPTTDTGVPRPKRNGKPPDTLRETNEPSFCFGFQELCIPTMQVIVITFFHIVAFSDPKHTEVSLFFVLGKQEAEFVGARLPT